MKHVKELKGVDLYPLNPGHSLEREKHKGLPVIYTIIHMYLMVIHMLKNICLSVAVKGFVMKT